MTHTPARRHRRARSPQTAAGKARRAIRRPVWRWSFLAVAAAGWVLLGADVAVWVATALALYAWWPHPRPGKARRRRGARRR